MPVRNVSIRVQTDGKADVKRDMTEIGQAGAGAYTQIASGADKATAATDKQMAAWRRMAAAAKEAQAAGEAQAKFNAILGVGGAPGKSAAESADTFLTANPANGNGLNRIQNMMLQSAGFRTFESLASGMPLSRIAIQQGGEVAAAFGMGDGGLGAALSGVLKFINPVTVGLGLLGAASVAGAAAAIAHAAAMDKLEISAKGLGLTAGLTGEQLNEMAVTGAKMGEVSRTQGRDMAASYLDTGRIGAGVLEQLIAVTTRYAVATRQDAKAATTELAKAFADPAKGADTLNAKLNFLDGTTKAYIETLVSQGRETDAQAALVAALNDRLSTTPTRLNAISGWFDHLKIAGTNAFDSIGSAIDRLFGGGKAEDRIGRLEKLLTNPLMAMIYGGVIKGKIAGLQGDIAADNRHQTQAPIDQAVADAMKAMGEINPLPGKLLELQGRRSQLTDPKAQAGFSPDQAKEAAADLSKVNKEIAAVSAGYASAEAQAAAFKRAQSEAAAEARKAAVEAKKLADQSQFADELRAKNLLTLAKLSGDKVAVDNAEHELKLRQQITDFQRTGLTYDQAKIAAERQIGLEIQAEYIGTVALIEKQAIGLKTTADLQKRLALVVPQFDANTQALDEFKTAGVKVFQGFADSLTAGEQGWKSWGDAAKSALLDIIGEFEKLALINPMMNALFGGVKGYQSAPAISNIGSFFASLFHMGANANGTDNWAGGWSMVGEKGPEPVWMPPGSRVVSNAQSSQMGGHTFNITLNAPGADAGSAANIQRQIAMLKRELPGIIVSTVNDGISRRRIAA